ncbi:MAG: hypothetical protein ABSH33_03575 [Steroidobacteraceae bacterium]|jgi:hypothetical protein
MRVVWAVVLLWVAGCASEKLAVTPAPGVDFSGHWQLNEADSDDPQRVALSQNAAAAAQNGANGGQGGQDGQGGRGGGRGSRGGSGPGNFGSNVPLGPAMPGVSALSDGLRWPGKQLDIRQAAGVVTIASQGAQQIYKPVAGIDAQQHQGSKPSDANGSHGRDARDRDRGDGPLPVCGWDDKTLVIRSENPDDDHPPFEERYSLSDDGQRLVEVVAFKGGRSGGFTVSRVWDRASPGGASDASSGTASGMRPPPP